MLIPVTNLPLGPTEPAANMNYTKHLWQFGINDTCGKFADGVNVTSGKERYQAALK
jgi:hypothetical protein